MKKPYILAAIAIFIWSTAPVISKNLLGSFSSMQIVCISALFASIFLIVLNIANKKIKILKTYRLKDFITTILIGLPGTFLYYLFLYFGTDKMLASQAFIINYLWPIMSIVFACIILKEKMTAKGIIAIAMSFLGVIIVTGENLLHFDKNTILGAFFCIMGAVSYGSFTALNKRFTYDKAVSMMLSYSTTFIITAIITLFTENNFMITPLQLLGFGWNGIFSYAVGTTCWAMALDIGSTNKISNLAYITPFLALVWTAIFLGEPIELTSILGLVVIVAGILLQLNHKPKTTK